MSRTMCLPVVMLRSVASPWDTFTTALKRYALPCWPRKFCGGQGWISLDKVTERQRGGGGGKTRRKMRDVHERL